MTAPRRRASFGLALAGLAAVGLAACTSDPGPRAVARDVIELLDVPQDVKDCMNAKLDTYTNDELEAIGEADQNADFSAANPNLDAVTPEMRRFVEDLGECTSDPTSAPATSSASTATDVSAPTGGDTGEPSPTTGD